jgi:hypothetical protein
VLQEEAARALGVHHRTGSVRRADRHPRDPVGRGRQPSIGWCPPPPLAPRDARLELARRYLHVFGPATPKAFADWAGISDRGGVAAFEALAGSLIRCEPRSATLDPPPTSLGSLPSRDLRRPRGSSRAGTRSFFCRVPTVRCWSPIEAPSHSLDVAGLAWCRAGER